MIGWIKNKMGGFLLREEGGKKVINKRNALLLSSATIMVGIALSLAPTILSRPDSSQIKHSDMPLSTDSSGKRPPPVNPSSPKPEPIGGVSDHAKDGHGGRQRHLNVRYRARQVIGPGDGGEKIIAGAKFIGKLMSDIDTRSPQAVQVSLPYGTSDKVSGGSLPKETILFGQLSYPGQGERVYVNFDHGVLPDGREIAIQARALSSKDYSPGIIGDFHGNKLSRMGSVLGLSMVSGMSEVMVEKEGLGRTFEATPKATLKNGLYNGVSKVSEMEATHQAETLNQTPEYVTVLAGSDLIVTLTGNYRLSNERAQ